MYFFSDMNDPRNGREYRLIVQDLGDGSWRTFEADDDMNPYQPAYLAWVADGNEPQPWEPVTTPT